jgi:hypothetical protein
MSLGLGMNFGMGTVAKEDAMKKRKEDQEKAKAKKEVKKE